MRFATKRRLAMLANREGRSLSAQIERLVEAALDDIGYPHEARRAPHSLAGVFAGAEVPTLRDFREVRTELSRSLLKRTR
jgi:hypothetical protein